MFAYLGQLDECVGKQLTQLGPQELQIVNDVDFESVSLSITCGYGQVSDARPATDDPDHLRIGEHFEVDHRGISHRDHRVTSSADDRTFERQESALTHDEFDRGVISLHGHGDPG